LIEAIKVENDDDKYCWCSFMPLRLAYALTIHKSQGMTLDLVVIDLGDSIFEYGQAYTAISRARSLSCIKLLDFKSSSFRTHKDVLKFYGVVP
jgi:ATP-dependent DNA helicase PIF1